MLVLVDVDLHRAALRGAREVGVGTPLALSGYTTMLDNAVLAEVTKIWDKIEQAIVKACQSGAAAAQPLVEQVETALGEFSSSASKTAREVRAAIIERLQDYLQRAFDGALRRVHPVLTVGGRELTVRSVRVDHAIKVSTSIKASLSEICAFAADGEITLSAEYGSAA